MIGFAPQNLVEGHIKNLPHDRDKGDFLLALHNERKEHLYTTGQFFFCQGIF